MEDPFEQLVALCAAYRDRHREWPAQVRLDPKRLRDLCRGLDDSGIVNLAAHVRLGTRDSPGMSAGGRGVVQLGNTAPSEGSLELARLWLGGIDRGYRKRIRLNDVYWRETTQRTLDAFPSERALGVQHWLHAAEMGPIRVQSRNGDEEERRRELLFHVTYLASFGLHGVLPKTLAIGRRSYGWQRPEDYAEVTLMLHRDDGMIAMTEPPYDVLDVFPVERDRLHDAMRQIGQRFAELAATLAE